MSMLATCPECAAEFRTSDEMLGKKAKCGQCHTVFVVKDVDEDQPAPEPEPKTSTKAPKAKNADEMARVSLYLAAMAVGLLIVRGNSGGLVATLLVSLMIESAAGYFAWRGFMDAKRARSMQPNSYLARTGYMVNGVLLLIFLLSIVLTLYQMTVGEPNSGIPGLGELFKILKQNQNQMDDIMKNIK